MPTTRAARAAARRAAERQLLELPADVLGLVLYQLPLAHDIALAGLTCRQLCDAAKLALKLRPFTGKVVTLAGHTALAWCVAAMPDGRVITGSDDRTVKIWRDGVCERTIQAHTSALRAVAVLPGGARFVSGSLDGTAKLWTLDGVLERTFHIGSNVLRIAVLPDGVHFVAGLGAYRHEGDLRLYHFDGTLVHTFKGRDGYGNSVYSVAVTHDGQHIISGSSTSLAVWSVATKSLLWEFNGNASALALMPDGQRFLSGANDNTVRVWLLDGTLENTFELHTRVLTGQFNSVMALATLPDNQHALAGSVDCTVKLFNVNDGTVLLTFTHHVGSVECLALMPDGLRFVSCSEDRAVRIAYHGLAPQRF